MTIPDLFDRSVSAMAREVAIVHWSPRIERRLSTATLAERVRRVSAGLIVLGLSKGDRVLLISENRPEWAVTDYATMFAGGILVPVYVSLTRDQLRYVLENSGASIAVASSQALLDKLVAAAAGLRTIRQIVVIDQDAAADDVMHLDSVAAMGDDLLATDPEAWRAPASRLRPEDVATIIYTSGTTGPPKGVMLSHGNLVSNVTKLCEVLDMRPDDVALSFLPLCHVTQRLADYCYFNTGVRIVHVGLEDLPAALAGLRPTTFPAVPRVYEKIRDTTLSRAARATAPVRWLFRWGLAAGHAAARCRIEGRAPGPWLAARHALADRLVLSKVRDGFGGRVRYLVSGGAPLPAEVTLFFLAAGLPILEGYGLTETTVLTINRHGRLRPGTVGPPLPEVEIRIEEDGEVVARGPGVGRGYYLDVKRTEASFREGWFHTGDLGRLEEDGSLRITGRKKDLLVTSGGKKISPAPIEQSILADGLVSQVVLVGDGHKFISALLVPDKAQLMARLGTNRIPYAEVLRKPEVRILFQKVIDRSNRALARFEQIKKFALLSDEFTLEGGELTPTLKIKRQVVEEKYRAIIDGFYAEAREEGS